SGITSAPALASHQDLGQISVGYIDGGIQNDLGFDLHNDLGGPVLATNRILVRPSYNGDLNFDGYVDGNDIGIIISLGYYGAGTAPHGWFDGDINGDGVVDGNDLGIIIGAGTYDGAHTGPAYGAKSSKSAKASATLSGAKDAVAQTCVEGTFGDGQFDYIVNPNTGDIRIWYDNDTRITTVKPLQRLVLASAGGRFITANLNTSGFSGQTDTSNLLDCLQASTQINDGYDLGSVLPPGLSPTEVLQDLTVQFQVKSGGLGVKTADVVGLPE